MPARGGLVEAGQALAGLEILFDGPATLAKLDISSRSELDQTLSRRSIRP
jgi:hypothetical protein